MELPIVTIRCRRPSGEDYELSLTGFPTAHPQLVLTPTISGDAPNGEWNLTHRETGYALGHYGGSIKALFDLAQRLTPFDFTVQDSSTYERASESVLNHPHLEQIRGVINDWYREIPEVAVS